MKTLMNLTITALIVGSMLSIAQAGEEEKYYTVTEDGRFQYIYRQANAPVKDGTKPVTNRTFYLETVRKGLLPQNLSYREYLQLTPEEIQALLNQPPLNHEESARVDNQYAEIENPVDQTVITKDIVVTEVEQIEQENSSAKKNEPLGLPWIIEVSVNPTDGYNLPDEFEAFESCADCTSEVPQVVNDVVKHGDEKSASKQATWVSENPTVYTVVK